MDDGCGRPDMMIRILNKYILTIFTHSHFNSVVFENLSFVLDQLFPKSSVRTNKISFTLDQIMTIF